MASRSALPSPLKSPAMRLVTRQLPGMATVALALKLPSPFPREIVTELDAAFPTARSSFPSPLKSAVAAAMGPFCVGYRTPEWKDCALAANPRHRTPKINRRAVWPLRHVLHQARSLTV